MIEDIQDLKKLLVWHHQTQNQKTLFLSVSRLGKWSVGHSGINKKDRYTVNINKLVKADLVETIDEAIDTNLAILQKEVKEFFDNQNS